MAPVRVLLVDDHVMFRKGLVGLIQAQGEYQVVGEAGDGLEAYEKARQLTPDLILMDVKMPRCDGIRATRLIKQEMPQVTIVMLTVSDEEEDLFEAIKAGAQGYLLKDVTPETFFELIRGVRQGEAPLSPAVAVRILKEFRRQNIETRNSADPRVVLSPREKEILQMVVDGATNEEVAARLYIAPGTVKNHLHNILTKLHLKNRAQIIAYAVEEGVARPAKKREP